MVVRGLIAVQRSTVDGVGGKNLNFKLIPVVFFTALTIVLFLVGAAGKFVIVFLNPLLAILALLAFIIAAISFLVRWTRSTPASNSRPGSGGSLESKVGHQPAAESAFWVWTSRISGVVGLGSWVVDKFLPAGIL